MSSTNEEVRARESSNAVFSAHSPVEGKCALYTYNHAYYFMNGQLSPSWGGHGDMGTDAYYNNIMNLGYTKIIDENNLTKDTLKYRIRSDVFPPGSVICYKGNTPPSTASGTSYYKYGHTQFYIGGNKTAGYSFPSSTKDNYGNSFVYGSRNCDSWRYLVFVPSGSSAMRYCEQEYVPTSNFPTGSGHEFYEPYNVEISDSQRNANGLRILSRLKGELGVSDAEASAFAGCFWVESKWNPTAYSRHPKQHDYGIAQWTTPYGRQQKLFEMCNNDKEQFRNLEKQIDFVVFELKNRYTSPTNGGTFSYNNLVPTLKKMSANGASLVELTWRVVCDYEAGGNFNGVSYSQAQYNSNANHIKERYEGAQKAMKLLGH